jgi:adenosylcobyric acid synthase
LVQQGNCLGTYVHGIFDNEDLAFRLVSELANRKGLSLDNQAALNYQEFKEGEYDKLAQVVRTNLDMDYIYGLLK